MLALVTGAQGALGRSLTLKLLAEGLQVHVLTRGAWRGLDSDIGVIEGRRIAVSQCDLKSATAVENLILGINPSLIYHLSSNNDNGRDGVDGISVLRMSPYLLLTYSVLRDLPVDAHALSFPPQPRSLNITLPLLSTRPIVRVNLYAN